MLKLVEEFNGSSVSKQIKRENFNGRKKFKPLYLLEKKNGIKKNLKLSILRMMVYLMIPLTLLQWLYRLLKI